MFNNHYGKQKDGSILEYDMFMTVGKTMKWDYDEKNSESIRVFNPDTNETMFTVTNAEIEEHFGELVEDVPCWDEITEYVNGSCRDVITEFYNRK